MHCGQIWGLWCRPKYRKSPTVTSKSIAVSCCANAIISEQAPIKPSSGRIDRFGWGAPSYPQFGQQICWPQSQVMHFMIRNAVPATVTRIVGSEPEKSITRFPIPSKSDNWVRICMIVITERSVLLSCSWTDDGLSAFSDGLIVCSSTATGMWVVHRPYNYPRLGSSTETN